MPIDISQKTITLQDASNFLGIPADRIRNLIRIGKYASFAEILPPLRGTKNNRYYIRAGDFLKECGITWDDVFEARQKHLQEERTA